MARLLLLLLLCSPWLEAQSLSLKVDATYIKVPVTVLDPQGRVLTGLKREQFQLLDEGQTRRIENFVLDEAPLYVVLLLDVSGSVRREIEEIREAAYRFVRVFDAKDRIAVYSFADQLTLLQDWTHDVRRLRRSLRRLQPGYRTTLYDSLLTTVRRKLGEVAGRKAIILLTDGIDNESMASFDELVDPLIRADVTLYIVSRTRLVAPEVAQSKRVHFMNRLMKNLIDRDEDFVQAYFREKERSMSYLAEATGGLSFFPQHLEELGGRYLEIAHQLKTRYLLTFRPPASSSKEFRKIEVRCSAPVGQIHYRSRYHWN